MSLIGKEVCYLNQLKLKKKQINLTKIVDAPLQHYIDYLDNTNNSIKIFLYIFP